MSHEGHIPETRPGGTVIQGPVLEVPMVLGHAIDVTPTPHVSDAFLGDSRVNRSLPLWRKAVITGTAFVAGVTAAGVTPKPAEANGFILTGSTASSECIDDSEVYVLKREPGIAVGNTEAQLVASVAQPQTGKTATADQELPQDVEIAILPDGTRLHAVIVPPCPPVEPNFDNYTVEFLSKKKYEPIDKKAFMETVETNAPAILEYTKAYPELDTLEEVIADYERVADIVIERPTPRDGGHILVGSINAHLSLAKTFARTNLRIADGLMALADAYRKLGQRYIDFGTKNPNKIDQRMDKLIRENR